MPFENSSTGLNGNIVQIIPKGNGEEYTDVYGCSATLIEVPTVSIRVNHAAHIITFAGSTT